MDIKKTGLLKQIMGLAKKNISSVGTEKKDALNVSNQGKLLSELDSYKKLVLSVPDVREDKVKEIKEKLNSGYYASKDVYNHVANNLSSFLNEGK